ncbi:MAG: hypothetical protein HOF83_09740 [Pelagibacteraceae bacterium]|nr:hypothetical protein [Pelagibacteraceae bacterium]
MYGKRHTIHTLDGTQRGKIYIKASREELDGTLEFRHYAGIVAEFLQSNGFRRTKNESDAKYIGLLNYGLSTEGNYSTIYKLDVSNDIGHSINTEVIEYALYPKKTFIKNQGYTRVFELNIFDLKENKDTSHIYQGKIVSKGQCGEMQEVAPHLIKMMFKKWPGKNGSKRILSMKSGIC